MKISSLKETEWPWARVSRRARIIVKTGLTLKRSNNLSGLTSDRLSSLERFDPFRVENWIARFPRAVPPATNFYAFSVKNQFLLPAVASQNFDDCDLRPLPEDSSD
jgi:hypothetical protein